LRKKGTETTVKQKYETGGVFVKYNTGPFALGLGRHGVAPNIGGDSSGTCATTTAVKSYSTSVSSTTGLPSTTTSYCSGTSHFINTAASVAYAVNDNLSVSFDRMKSTAHVTNTAGTNVSTETNRDLQVDSIQAAYNIGGAVVAIGQKSVDGVNYADDNNVQETVFSLKMEF